VGQPVGVQISPSAPEHEKPRATLLGGFFYFLQIDDRTWQKTTKEIVFNVVFFM
jgi:hypothetical protein